MKRIKLTVAYDGTRYNGWQLQPGVPTVEGELNKALCALTGEKIAVIGASRTDAGVHALGNVAVFDTCSPIPPERFSYALNTLLPKDVVVMASEKADPGFHPRHCDTVKTYEYRYDNAPFPNPLMSRYAWHIRHPMDLEAMDRAARCLVGEHDFKSFCCVRSQAETTVRTIYSIGLEKCQEGHIALRVRGNGFLYNMVRIIAGTLAQVGTGLRTPQSVEEALLAADRTKAGLTAPPHGLRLLEIQYRDA